MTDPAEPPAASGDSSARVPVIGLAHGSRHPRGQQAVEALLTAVAAQRGVPARGAYLDFVEPDLTAVCASLRAAGHRAAVVVPLLFTAAFHARVDVPKALAAASAATGMTLHLADILGTGDDVAQVMLGALADAGPDAGGTALLVAVGSSRPEANAAVGALARRIDAKRDGDVEVGFCTCEPRADHRLESGSAPVVVCPLFLADGRLLDPLRQQASQRGSTFVEPLGDRAAPLVLARYDAARAAFTTGAGDGLG